MKINNKSNKKNFLEKILIKLIRKFGYEIIDQTNLNIPFKNLKANDNLSESGKKSVTIPLGETKVYNKINSLSIIIRSYTFGNAVGGQVMLDQSKKRIFDQPKIEYTLRTINSIIKSCEYSKSFFKDLNIKLIITDDNSNDQNLLKYDFKYEKYFKIFTDCSQFKIRYLLFFRR